MILKLILIVLVLVIFLKQENLPLICYKLGRLIKMVQKLANDLSDYFWSLYDMGELQSHLKIYSKSNSTGDLKRGSKSNSRNNAKSNLRVKSRGNMSSFHYEKSQKKRDGNCVDRHKQGEDR